MIIKIGKKKFNLFSFDIESHNDPESVKKMETSMWLGCLYSEGDISYVRTMDEFFDLLEDKSRIRRNKAKTRLCANMVIYVYNLSFEYSFMLPYILKRGFKYTPALRKESEMEFASITNKTCSNVWQVSLKYSHKHGTIVFKDMAKMFDGGLAQVAKQFDLEVQKGKIDYTKNRLDPNYEPTKEEIDYITDDCAILFEITKKLWNMGDRLFFKSLSLGSYSLAMLIKTGFGRSLKPYKEFRTQYPRLKKEESEFVRNSIAGGITYCPSLYQFKELSVKICHIDAHSMHPSSAYLNRFPYGYGEYFVGEPPPGKICCCRIRFSFQGVKLHSIIKLIGWDFFDKYELTVWNFEIPTMKKCYNNVEIEYIDGYAYNSKLLPWRKYYKDRYQKRIEAEKVGDKFAKYFNKKLINTSYGKMLEKPHMQLYENYINEVGIIDSLIHEKTKDPKITDEEWEFQQYNCKYTYLPVGSCIPAYSRVCLIEMALKIGWQYITYFDTDSIFFIWNEDTKKALYDNFLLKDCLGGWAIEEFVDRAQFAVPKRYKTETAGVTTIKAGGFNFPEGVGYDDVNLIYSKWEVHRGFRAKGGTIIDYQEKKIQVPKKYSSTFNKNVLQ